MKVQISFPQIIERVAGMDVYRDIVVETVMGTRILTETKTFTTYTKTIYEVCVHGLNRLLLLLL